MGSPKPHPYKNELLAEISWIDQQIDRRPKIVDISTELLREDFKLPPIPRLPRQRALGMAEQIIPPDPGISAETSSRLLPCEPDIYKRLGEKQTPQQIAEDLALTLNVPVGQVILHIELLRAKVFAVALEVMMEDLPKKLATETIAKFLMEGKPVDSESEQRMQVTWDSYEGSDISLEQQEQCEKCMGKIRRHLYLLEEVNVRSGLLSSQLEEYERRGVYTGQLLVGLSKASLIVGFEYDCMVMERSDWDDALSLLQVACDPAFQYLSYLIAGCLKSGSVNQKDAREIGGNAATLTRLYAVECFLTGLAVHTDPSYSVA